MTDGPTPYRRWQSDPDHVDAAGLTGAAFLRAVTKPLKVTSLRALTETGVPAVCKPKSDHPVKQAMTAEARRKRGQATPRRPHRADP